MALRVIRFSFILGLDYPVVYVWAGACLPEKRSHRTAVAAGISENPRQVKQKTPYTPAAVEERGLVAPDGGQYVEVMEYRQGTVWRRAKPRRRAPVRSFPAASRSVPPTARTSERPARPLVDWSRGNESGHWRSGTEYWLRTGFCISLIITRNARCKNTFFVFRRGDNGGRKAGI